MRQLNLYSAKRRYNVLMNEMGYEHNTIGEGWSDKTENWNLRDMVAECDYLYSTFFEEGHCNEELRHSEDAEERKMWKSWTGRLERFISSYEPFIKDMKCTQRHCSRFDKE